MPRENYKNRPIFDVTGKELTEQEKEAAYNLTSNILDSVEAEDESKKSIDQYLLLNNNYKAANLSNNNKPFESWTSNEILTMIRKCRKNTGLGSVGRFEASDRVRNFRSRFVLQENMSNALKDMNEARTDAVVDAFIGAAAIDNKAVDDNKIAYKNAVINWIPYLTRLKKDNSPLYDQYKGRLEPSRFVKNMAQDQISADMCALDMLEIIEDTDMEEFAYTDNATFAADFAKKYEKLKALAGGAAIIEHIKSQNNNVFRSRRDVTEGNEDSSKVTEAKCKLAQEILKDYETRMRIITSPFYSVFAGKDFEKTSEKKLISLRNRTKNPAMKAYFNDVIEFKRGKSASFKGANITERLTTHITNIKPIPAPEVKLESDKTMEQMDRLIQTMYADSMRASNYKKVKRTIRRYLETQNAEEKANLLNEVITASNTYLNERSNSSYQFRKERCEALIELHNKYNNELAAEQQAIIDAEQASIDRENELKNKAAEMHSKMEDRLDDYRAREAQHEEAVKDLLRQEAEARERARLEEEARLERERLSEEERARLEAEENERIRIAEEAHRERRIKRETMEQAIEKYESLGTIGKSYVDSDNARKAVLDYLDKYVFDKDKSLDADYDRDAIDTVPTVMLIETIKEHKNDIDSDNYAQLIKSGISKKIWDNAPTHEEFRKPVTDIMNKKPGEITELDRLNAYEYSVHVLNYGAGAEVTFDSLRNMDLSDIISLGLHYINYDEAAPDMEKNEKYEELSYVQQKKHINESAELLSFFSGKDADTYKYLPIEEISNYAEDVVMKMNEPDEQKKTLDEALEKASSIKKNQELLDEAIDLANKDKLIEAITTITGSNQDDLKNMPTADIIDLARRMYDKSMHYDEMIKSCNEFKKVLADRNEDYYREVFLDFDLVKRTEGLDKGELLTRRENGYSYIRKALNAEDIPEESLSTLDDDALYKLVSNIGIIKLSDEDLESVGLTAKDYDRAVNDLQSMNLSAELNEGVNKIIKSDAPAQNISDIEGNEITDNDVDINYATSMAESFETNNSMTYEENEANKNQHKKEEVENKIKEMRAEEKWEESGTKLLNIIGDLYLASSQNPIDVSIISQSIINNASAFSDYINHSRNIGKEDPFGELLSGLSENERIFIEGAKPMLDELANFCLGKLNNKSNSMLRWKNVSEVFKNNIIDIDLSKVSDMLNNAALKGEDAIVKLMHTATDDCFDQIGGMGIPNIFNLEGDKNADKEYLEYAQNNLRYNKEAGQGKFLQTLMNDYFRDSNPEDKRQMLSYIIKDFKKNDKESTEKEKGGEYFASSLKGAGPVMQKMMQGVPEYIVVPELRNAINVVKSDLRPIDTRYVNQTISEIKDKCKKQIKDIKIEKRLGAASVAETFLCTIKGPKNDEKEAVIKILRPDAKERMKRELPLIKRSAVFADMPDSEVAKYKQNIKNINNVPPHKPRTTEAGFLAQLSEIEKEFDLKNEAKNCKTGKSKYGNKDEKVKSVDLIDVPMAENYLIMNKAEGITLDRHIKESRELAVNSLKPFQSKSSKEQKTYKLTLDNITEVDESFDNLKNNMYKSLQYGEYVGKVAKLWTGEALFGSAWNPLNNYNFRHGDLHSGNIMVSDDGATILDYGNASKLHHEKVTEIMKMMMSVVSKKPEYFVEAMSELINMSIKEDKKSKNPIGYEEISPEVKQRYIKELDKIFNTGSPEDAGIKILLSLTKAQSLGIKLPAELQNFSQCQQRLENSMSEIKQATVDVRRSLDRIERMPLDESIKNSMDPRVVFQRMMLEKDEKGNYKYDSSYTLSSMLLDKFSNKEALNFVEEISPLMQKIAEGIDVKDDVEKYKKKYYDRYNELLDSNIGSEQITLDTFPKKVNEWRKLYKKLKEEYKESGDLSIESKRQLSYISGFITSSAFTNGLFTEYETKERIEEMNKKALTPPFDDLAFEKLMTVFTVDIGSISTNIKSLDNLMYPSTAEDKLVKEFEKAGGDPLDTIMASKYKTSKYVMDFVERLRDTSKADAFEKEMARVFEKNPKFKEYYQNYKTAKTTYDNLTLENSSDEFVKSRMQMNILENKLVKEYTDICASTFKKMKENTADTLQMKDIEDSALLSDYVDVIYEVIWDNKGNAFKRLGTKYTKGIDLDEKELDKENDKNIDKSKEKADKSSNKKEDKKEDEKENSKKKKVDEKKRKKEEEKKKKGRMSKK
ncbi:MAG: hypothetical protein IJ703_03300 [Eubacterium sp.]|nr:hypothetical protein [Eubacterium sp.]